MMITRLDFCWFVLAIGSLLVGRGDAVEWQPVESEFHVEAKTIVQALGDPDPTTYAETYDNHLAGADVITEDFHSLVSELGGARGRMHTSPGWNGLSIYMETVAPQAFSEFGENSATARYDLEFIVTQATAIRMDIQINGEFYGIAGISSDYQADLISQNGSNLASFQLSRDLLGGSFEESFFYQGVLAAGTYSFSEITRSSSTSIEESQLSSWLEISLAEPCDSGADLNQDGFCDHHDMDQLSAMIRQADYDPAFDINLDRILDQNDRTAWLEQMHSSYGDANLDGAFRSDDLTQVFISAEYEDAIPLNSTWPEGDWNGDGDFNSTDLIWAFRTNNYEAFAAHVNAVPEPMYSVMTWLVVLHLLRIPSFQQRWW